MLRVFSFVWHLQIAISYARGPQQGNDIFPVQISSMIYTGLELIENCKKNEVFVPFLTRNDGTFEQGDYHINLIQDLGML